MSIPKKKFSLKPRQNLERIKPYQPGLSIEDVKQQFGHRHIIKMASNENPLGPPLTDLQMKELIEGAHLYPDISHSRLPTLLSEKIGVTSQQLIFGNGSDEILLMLGLAFLTANHKILISQHTFSEYQFIAELMDAPTIRVPMCDYRYDLEGFLHAYDSQTKLIFIANPNNPTGTYVTHQEISHFLDKLPSDCLVVLDEAYMEYVSAPDFPRSIELMKTYENLMVLRTFSKLYGLAGFRIGYGIGHSDLINVLQKVRQPFNVNRLAIKAAEIAVNAQDYIQESLKLNQNGKAEMCQALDKMKLNYCSSEANFVCIFLPVLADDAVKQFLEEGIIIRSLTSFGLKKAIRVTIGNPEDNQKFIQILSQICQSDPRSLS